VIGGLVAVSKIKLNKSHIELVPPFFVLFMMTFVFYEPYYSSEKQIVSSLSISVISCMFGFLFATLVSTIKD
jgi:hypothetical protein